MAVTLEERRPAAAEGPRPLGVAKAARGPRGPLGAGSAVPQEGVGLHAGVAAEGRRRANSRSRSLVESRWHCSSKQQQLTWPPAESSPIMGCFRLELHPLVCGLCGQPHSGRPADRLCFPPLPSQVRSRPTTSSARAAGDLAAVSRWSRAAPSPSATLRARVDEVLRAC